MDTTGIYNEYLSGDAKALERLVEYYGDKLTLYINGYVKNLHDSEDLMIEVFAYLISKRPNIKIGFESYIYKAARNHALMFLRRAKRQTRRKPLKKNSRKFRREISAAASDSAGTAIRMWFTAGILKEKRFRWRVLPARWVRLSSAVRLWMWKPVRSEMRKRS